MMRQIKKVQWLVPVFILVTGVVGCHRKKIPGPTAPQTVEQNNHIRIIPVPQTNFNVNEIESDQIGAYVGHEFFLVQVPAGTYRLEYFTDLGTFNLVFRNTVNALLFIGLQPGDQVHRAVLYRGTIIDTSKEPQEYNKFLTIFCWPDGQVQWWEVFRNS